jgi:putative drug exporter of the RND superfamily
MVADTPPPPGVGAYVTGAAPLITDQFEVGSKGTLKVTPVLEPQSASGCCSAR